MFHENVEICRQPDTQQELACRDVKIFIVLLGDLWASCRFFKTSCYQEFPEGYDDPGN
jgi:hypothetical protein